MPTTAQQVNTLLRYLTTKQQPPFAVLFWSALQKIDFDYRPASLQRIEQLFAQLGQRGIDLAKILSQQGGEAFLLTIAIYLGAYLAKQTSETLTWYDYPEICRQIDEQNRLHHTQFVLPNEFASSLVANIGDVYCQPLKLLPSLLAGEPVLTEFMTNMEQAIFAKNQTNLLDEANTIAKHYLAKLKTGKLLDKSIAFYPYFAEISFDFSEQSLIEIDSALAKLTEQQALKPADYAHYVNQPNVQALVYLLGFYIGATSCHLANVASKWADFDDMSAMLGGDFSQCIEHRFVQLMEGHYRTPMLVITNRLFGISPNFPTSAVAFAQIIAEQNGGNWQIFSAKNLSQSVSAKPLPALYQQVMQKAGQLLSYQLKQVLDNQPIIPRLIQVDSTAEQTITLSSLDIDTALDKLYRQLGETGGLWYQVASFGLLTNLPLGQLDAIALEIRINPVAESEPLALQLLLPYRIDKANNLPMSANLVLYPLISNQPNLSNITEQCVDIIYQQLPSKLLQACAVATLNPWATSPYQQATANKLEASNQALLDEIELTLLPLSTTQPPAMSPTVGLDLALPPFDYQQLNWRGFDLPKYVLETPEAQREYLQVVVPDGLINDELFSQAEQLQRLYRYGKVVWGVVVVADDDLYQYDESVAQSLIPNKILTADILYDPTGQASVGQLRQANEQLQRILTQPIDQLPPDQALYISHTQDSRSRLFSFGYPQSLSKNSFKISTVWLWRRHLPDGVLHAVVPVMVEPDSSSQPATAKGRLMVLPSRLWQADFYQYWLAKTRQQLKLPSHKDLMPAIVWQEQQGFCYVGKGMDARLFPKFKFNTNLAKSKINDTPPMANLPKQAIVPTQSAVEKPALVTESSVIPTAVPSPIQPVIPTDNSPSDKRTALTPELQQQLLRDRARLQAELSTTDSDKQKKLYVIVGVMVVVLILVFAIAKLMR